MITEAIHRLRRDLDIPLDLSRHGPVPLDRFFREMIRPRVAHRSESALTRGRIVAYLRSEGVPIEDLGEPNEPLAGFLFCTRNAAWAFVNANDILSRRRFTAAHELGHAVLHREQMGQFISDVAINDSGESDQPMEREADQFAAELLMPEELIRLRAVELMKEFHACPRQVLAYRLASELLVSREAMRYRLKALGVGDE